MDSIPVGRAIELGADRIYVLQVGRVEQPLSVPRAPWDVVAVAFEISRRHRYVEEMAKVPESVALHVLPSGANSSPTLSFSQARARKVTERIESAYAATSAYLAGSA